MRACSSSSASERAWTGCVRARHRAVTAVWTWCGSRSSISRATFGGRVRTALHRYQSPMSCRYPALPQRASLVASQPRILGDVARDCVAPGVRMAERHRRLQTASDALPNGMRMQHDVRHTSPCSTNASPQARHRGGVRIDVHLCPVWGMGPSTGGGAKATSYKFVTSSYQY